MYYNTYMAADLVTKDVNLKSVGSRVRAHVFIHGYVQQVGFRWFLHQRAKDVGATGFVRNLDDGRVEAVFEGSKDQVEDMISYSRTGPDAAKVKSIDIYWEEPEGDWDELEITY